MRSGIGSQMVETGKEGRLRRASLLALLALFLLTGIGQATECLITVNTSGTDQSSPDISGNIIVWQDGRDNLIHYYDIAAGTEEILLPGFNSQLRPVISGPLVAWKESLAASTGIAFYRLDTMSTGTLTTDGDQPAVYGDQVVWVNHSGSSSNLLMYNTTTGLQSSPVREPPTDRTQPVLSEGWLVFSNLSQTRIYAKNLTTGEEILVATAARSHTIFDPAISGDRVVWRDRRGNSDIYINNLSGLKIAELVTGTGNRINPAIDGMRIVWTKIPDINLLDLAGSGTPETISTTNGNDFPKISGDRVVWQRRDSGSLNIYLYTIGSSQACPGAGFTADPLSGAAPLNVQFTDTSTGSPAHWFWDFGDGATSVEQNPSHTYVADGTYSVSLTVANGVGRNYTSAAGAIRIGPVPVVSFSANQSYGIAPLAVRFTDTSSGDPHSWAWDFGDGSPSLNQSQVIHTYASPGTYGVTLSATNTNGTGTGSPRSLRVLNGVESKATTDFDWLVVETAGASQHIALDTTGVTGLTFDPIGDPTLLTFVPPPSTGWQRMTFSSADPAGFSLFPNGTIMGNLGSCTLESRDLIPSTFGTGIGNNLPASYRLSLSAYPVNGEMNATVWEGVLPDDETAARLALAGSANFTSLIGGAYTLHLVSTNITPVTGATLNLSVSSAWVQANGNQNNIAVARLQDSGSKEVLIPAATFTDPATNLDFYSIPSPNGFSRFVLVSATGSSNLIQMATRAAAQVIQSSGIGYTSGGSSSKEAPPQVKSPQPAQPLAERPAATYYGEGKIDTTPAGIARDPVIISAPDHGASLAIDAGTEAFDSMHEPLTLATARAVTAGSIPAMPDGAGIRFTGMAYDMGPDGATFDPPATIRFAVPDNQWDANTQYTIRSYSTTTGSWDGVPTTVDTGTRIVSGQVSHLCVFGLFTVPAAEVPTQAPVARAPVATPQEQPKPLPRTPMGTFTGMVGWIYATAIAHIPVSFTILLGVLASVYAFTRRAWLSRYRTWITMYLISMTGSLWALFLFTRGEPLWEPAFLFTTIAGLNLIVHILRFDRIDLSSRAWRGYVEAARR